MPTANLVASTDTFHMRMTYAISCIFLISWTRRQSDPCLNVCHLQMSATNRVLCQLHHNVNLYIFKQYQLKLHLDSKIDPKILRFMFR